MKTRLFVRQDVGHGDPIVLLHGIFADGTQWEKIVELLKNDYRVIVVDLLGHGKSPRPTNAQYTPDEHADALRSALESINATSNLTVVGYSMGGTVALSYCSKYQAGVRQLYMLSAPFYLTPDQMILNKYAASVAFTKFSQWFYSKVEKLLAPGKLLNFLVRYADRSALFHKMIGANDNKLESHIIQLNIKHMIKEFDFAGRLATLSIPTTYYAGKKDPFIVQGQVYALKKFNPFIDIRRLDIIKIDHMLVQNLPKEIVRLITVNKHNTLHVDSNKGTGGPIVLLHGIESSSSYWDPIAPILSEKHHIITIDLLGFGKSPKPKNIAYSLDDQVTWLHKTLKDLHLSSFTLVGHSLGGLVALAYAAKYPREVSRLVLFAPVLLPDNNSVKKISVKALRLTRSLPSETFLYSQIAESLGEEKLQKYIPSVRSVENAIHNQRSYELAKQCKNIPISIYYGTSDPLVDGYYVTKTAKVFKNSTVHTLPNKNHNFAIFSPEIALQAIDSTNQYSRKPKKHPVMPQNFIKQLAKLAAPTLLAKALLYGLLGILLFSSYASTVLVIGLSLFIIVQGYKTIRGAFSLKNEGLSYISYALLGVLIGLIGYGLYNHPYDSLKIAIYTICGFAILVGLLRILVAYKWAVSKKIQRTLFASGLFFLLLGISAFAGSIVSVYIIVYAIAIYLIAQGIRYGWYAMATIAMAYIRGYNS